jgi:hypothetical protein
MEGEYPKEDETQESQGSARCGEIRRQFPNRQRENP